MSAIAVFT